MKNGSIAKIPGHKGKKSSINFYSIVNQIGRWFKAKKMREFHFLAFSTLLLLLVLGLHDYLNNFVYIVKINDREVGIIDNTKEVDRFVTQLTESCGNLYGMNLEPEADLLLLKEYKPGVKSNIDLVHSAIRQELKFVTDAYLITVDGDPFVAVREEDDLDCIITELKNAYQKSGYGVKTIGAYIQENLQIEPCSINPDLVLEVEDVVGLFVADETGSSQQAAVTNATADLLVSGNGHDPGYFNSPFSIIYLPDGKSHKSEPRLINEKNINVSTVEEVRVREAIPFEVEYIYDEEMWIVQREVTVEGKEGLKEVVYHVTRENGLEIERIKINETIIDEAVTQVETVGTAKVSAVGSGRFIWPVEGGGEITPGRGFSSWHTGIDIHASTGTNILAADSGVVWFNGYGGTQGNYLILYHGSFWTLYLHNSANLVSVGQEVQQGDVIAKAGSTGRSTGPHLHFEVRLDDGSGEWLAYYQHTPIDPLQFFTP
jgi:murein DD-endopeptidase MepM/ murein hydrolase activator NlpD